MKRILRTLSYSCPRVDPAGRRIEYTFWGGYLYWLFIVDNKEIVQ